MTSRSGVRIQDRAAETLATGSEADSHASSADAPGERNAPDERNAPEERNAPDERSWAGYFVGGLTIGAAFVLGAAIIYRCVFSALVHVR